MVSTLEQMQVPNGTGPGAQRSKRPLLATAPVAMLFGNGQQTRALGICDKRTCRASDRLF